MSDSDVDQPLSEKELYQLNAFLTSDKIQDLAMPLTMLDGFLTALAIGPEIIPPVMCLSHIWGDEEPKFESEEEATRVVAAFMRRWNSILHDFEEGIFAPIFIQEDEEENEPRIATLWCRGFMMGMDLESDRWNEFFDSDEGNHLVPVMFLAAGSMEELPEEIRRYVDSQGGYGENYKEMLELLPHSIELMRIHWLTEAHANRSADNDNMPVRLVED